MNGTGRHLHNVRVLLGGESRIRARRGWFEDRESFGPNATVTFSRLERRGAEQVLRVRFKLGQGPSFPWLIKELPLTGAPADLVDDPWSLGNRTRRG